MPKLSFCGQRTKPRGSCSPFEGITTASSNMTKGELLSRCRRRYKGVALKDVLKNKISVSHQDLLFYLLFMFADRECGVLLMTSPFACSPCTTSTRTIGGLSFPRRMQMYMHGALKLPWFRSAGSPPTVLSTRRKPTGTDSFSFAFKTTTSQIGSKCKKIKYKLLLLENWKGFLKSLIMF